MSDTLKLATRLQAMTDHDLAEAIRARGIAPAGIRDFFDLADALLDAGSVQRALSRLDRHTLALLAVLAELQTTGHEPTTLAELTSRLQRSASLHDIGEVPKRLVHAEALLLLAQEPAGLVLYRATGDQLTGWPRNGLPDANQLLSELPPIEAGQTAPAEHGEPLTAVIQLTAEQAFAATRAVDELLIETENEPPRLLSKGTVAMPDAKRLTAAMMVVAQSVPVYLRIVERAELLKREAGSWLITLSGQRWLLESSGRRWRALAAGWRRNLPSDIAAVLDSNRHSVWDSRLNDHLGWLYPAGGSWMADQVASRLEEAQLLGIVSGGLLSPVGLMVLDGDLDSAETELSSRFPPEIERVYLQLDLTVVAPGPLKPSVDARLRLLADPENRALASTYRISSASISRALAAGETSRSLLEFLSGVSLSGIPQPLGYLIAETAERYGLLRVGRLPAGSSVPSGYDDRDGHRGALSYLRSEDGPLIEAVLADQSLAPLELRRAGTGTAISRYEAEVVFWSLSDAHYPVAAEDENGMPAALHRLPPRAARPAPATGPVSALVQRLRLSVGTGPASGQAWLTRQLEVAIRNKTVLAVSIAMPDGTVAEYRLEPISVSGGRLRSREQGSAVERTLPLANILRLGPGQHSPN